MDPGLQFHYRTTRLTHWGRVTHICVDNLTIIGSDNGLSPGRRQAITLTNAGMLLIGPRVTNFNEISIEIQTFSLKKIRLKMSSAIKRKRRGLVVADSASSGGAWPFMPARIISLFKYKLCPLLGLYFFAACQFQFMSCMTQSHRIACVYCTKYVTINCIFHRPGRTNSISTAMSCLLGYQSLDEHLCPWFGKVIAKRLDLLTRFAVSAYQEYISNGNYTFSRPAEKLKTP